MAAIYKTDVFEVKAVHNSSDIIPSIDLFFVPLKKQITLTGAILEAQYTDDEYFIVFITEDCPYEEGLNIYVLDRSAELLESVELSAWYTPGILTKLRVTGPNQICFSFFDQNECWILEVLPKPKIQLWANNHPVKRNHPFLHKTYFKLIRTNDQTKIQST